MNGAPAFAAYGLAVTAADEWGTREEERSLQFAARSPEGCSTEPARHLIGLSLLHKV